jgi:hypothetical protein
VSRKAHIPVFTDSGKVRNGLRKPAQKRMIWSGFCLERLLRNAQTSTSSDSSTEKFTSGRSNMKIHNSQFRNSRAGKLTVTVIALITSVWLVACGSRTVDGSFFMQKGCVQCHSVSSLGVVSQNNTGPDLALAVEDAPQRFGKSLDMFWNNPTGTMQMVLASQIKLTPEEKSEALDLMKAAYEMKKNSGKAQK